MTPTAPLVRPAGAARRAALAVAASLALVSCSAVIPGSATVESTVQGAAPSDAAASTPGGSERSGTDQPGADSSAEQPAVSGPASQPHPDEPAGAAHPGELGTPPNSIDGIPLGTAHTTWDVALAPEAVILGFDTVARGLKSADSQAGRYTFAVGSVDGAALAEGRPLIVAGHGMGRIESVEETGEGTVITTSEASLADVISDGTIGWDADVRWDADWIVGEQPQALRGVPGGPVRLAGLAMVDESGRQIDVVANRTADGELNWTYPVGDNEIAFKITPGGDTMSVAIQVTRAQLTYTATGTVGSAQSTGRASYSGGELTGATIDTGGIDSKLKLSVAAAGAGSVPEFSFAIPGLMFKYPIMVGPVLVVIGISANVVGVAEVPASASVTFESNFSFSSAGGFSYDGSAISATAQLGGFTMDAGGADPAGFIGEYVNAQYGVAFPRVEISLFGAGPSAYIRPGMFLGAELTWGPVCKTAYVRGELIGGYDFALLGVSLATDKKTFWEDRKDARGDSCA